MCSKRKSSLIIWKDRWLWCAHALSCTDRCATSSLPVCRIILPKWRIYLYFLWLYLTVRLFYVCTLVYQVFVWIGAAFPCHNLWKLYVTAVTEATLPRPSSIRMLPNGAIAQKSNVMYSDWTVVRNRRPQTLLRGHKLWFIIINRYKRNSNFTLGQCLLPALALAIIMSVLRPQQLRTQQKSEHDTAVSELTHDCNHASTCPTWEHQGSVLFSMGIQFLNNPRHNNHNQTNRCHSFIQLLLLLSGQIIANRPSGISLQCLQQINHQ